MPTFVSSCKNYVRLTHRFLQLSARHRWWSLEALCLLSLAWLYVRVLPYRWWSKRLGTLLSDMTTTTPHPPDSTTLQVCKRLMTINHCLGGRFTCLMMAMAAHWMLGRRRIASRLLLGTRIFSKTATEPDHTLAAHAWLTVGGHIVMGHHDDHFTPIACFMHTVAEEPMPHGGKR